MDVIASDIVSVSSLESWWSTSKALFFHSVVWRSFDS
jgi:hypothetical protein